MILTTGIEYPTGQGMDFYGFEVLGFYLKRFLLYYSDYTPIRDKIAISCV